jgi:hypothetical protein
VDLSLEEALGWRKPAARRSKWVGILAVAGGQECLCDCVTDHTQAVGRAIKHPHLNHLRGLVFRHEHKGPIAHIDRESDVLDDARVERLPTQG